MISSLLLVKAVQRSMEIGLDCVQREGIEEVHGRSWMILFQPPKNDLDALVAPLDLHDVGKQLGTAATRNFQ